MNHTAFVLAAGFGTRLRPLTQSLPKPLVPVCGVPLLAYALALCARHGHRRVVVNAHHAAEALRAWEGEHEGVHVTLSVETPDILGTGGGLRHARPLLAERITVVNGDILCDADLSALEAAVLPGGAAMALRRAEGHRFRVVSAEAGQRVTYLRDLVQADNPGPIDEQTHFTGLHALDRAVLDDVPDGFGCIIRTAYLDLVRQRRMAAVEHAGTWIDIGTPAAYLDANLGALQGAFALPLDPWTRAGFARDAAGRTIGDPELVRGVELVGPVWIGPGARVLPGARLERTVVGPRATVPQSARLTDSVVWEGRHAPDGELCRVVVHDTGVLQVP